MSRARPPIATEAQVLRGVLRLLALEGVHAWRMNAGIVPIGEGPSRRVLRAGPKDVADIIGVTPRRMGINAGRFWACEVKRPGARPRRSQLCWLQSVNADGGIGFWTCDLMTVSLVLEWLGRGRRIAIAVGDDGDQSIDFAPEDPRP